MAKEKLKENVIQPSIDKKEGPIKKDDNLYKRQIKANPKPAVKIGIDTDGNFYDTLIAAAQESKLDIAKLESFSQMSQNRNQIYQLIDTMAEDSTIAAVLETYAEDATETNFDGRIVWAESADPNIAKFITYLLDTMNVDKNSYKWIYSLIKYGDLYLRLYRESEYNDKLFDDVDPARHLQSKKLNEDLAKVLESNITIPNQEIINKNLDKIDDLDEEFNQQSNLSKDTKILNEDINVKLFSVNDRYVHYLEMIPNPAEVYELTRLGKSYAYIQAPTTVNLYKQDDVLTSSGRMMYTFKKHDVNLFEATEFVHAALEDNSSRTPEEVQIFLTDTDYDTNSNALTYTVRRGQSLLYNTYKIWRELMLLEYSLLLNRVTKSSIIRIIGVEVGDMPKEQIGPHLQGIKSLIEQKTALDVGGGLSEYTNPGPIENNIYVPTHEGVGNITTNQIGGDVNVTGLEDLDHFNNKMFGSLKVPKNFFGFTDDAGGFDGGTSLSIISSRYAKTVKRVQNTYIQALTDAINLMLIDKGLSNYVNKFQLKMVAPTTREDLDRQDSLSSKVSLAMDVMSLVGDIKDLSSRLQVLKSLLATTVPDPTIGEIIQTEIDRLENLKNAGYELDENGDPIITEDSTGLTGTVGGDFGGDFGDDFGGDFGNDLDNGDFEDSTSDSSLPSPDSLGQDFTDSENF